MRTLLHVGCSSQDKSGLKGFNSDDWKEIRFDIDPSVDPDIEGTLTDMDDVATESVDAIYSSHNIEHVFPHEVHTVPLEFHRVLKQDGIVVLTCPDLISVCQAVVSDRPMETLYVSPAGPIAPIDILYGHRMPLRMARSIWRTRRGSPSPLCKMPSSKLGSSSMSVPPTEGLLICGSSHSSSSCRTRRP